MLDIKKLETFSEFKKRTLEKKEYLFKEWEKDNNIYILLAWELEILKYADKRNKKEEKQIAILKKNEVFWEASLNNNLEKQVSIKAKIKSQVLFINSQDLEKFNKKEPEITLNLLKYIIFLSNQRLNLSNSLLTATYKISEEIINLTDYSYKNIFKIIDNIQKITDSSEIIFLEENPVLKQYFTIKYKTSTKWKMTDEVIKISDNKLNLLELKVNWRYNHIQELKIWENNYWYLIFIKDKADFSENEKKVFTILSSSFSWLLKQKKLLKEQLNKEYLKNI